MSPDAYLVTAPDHIVVVPCRSPAAPLPSHVPITSSDEFATHGCLAAQAELVRSVRRDRCSSIIGNVGPTAVQRVGAILRMLICLDP